MCDKIQTIQKVLLLAHVTRQLSIAFTFHLQERVIGLRHISSQIAGLDSTRTRSIYNNRNTRSFSSSTTIESRGEEKYQT